VQPKQDTDIRVVSFFQQNEYKEHVSDITSADKSDSEVLAYGNVQFYKYLPKSLANLLFPPSLTQMKAVSSSKFTAPNGDVIMKLAI